MSSEHPTFEYILAWCASYGFCYSDSRTLLLARPWKHGTHIWANEEPHDTWFIWLAAGKGSLERMVELAPYPLPQVGFYRKGIPKCYSWDSLTKKIYVSRSESATTKGSLQRDL